MMGRQEIFNNWENSAWINFLYSLELFPEIHRKLPLVNDGLRCEADMEEDDGVAQLEVVVDGSLDGEHALIAEVDGDSDAVLKKKGILGDHSEQGLLGMV
ncbi:hypothetical protein Vadar_013975 [Vaccinium darrowii]|uniref:Uncharacterized protein n=1 Tax=Vaccinium darrowii TaxID=229202 RepID=A0ACB7Y6X1_9ERIC|nr:hypothetical protein Vadar_013975 [Vaccinium darrowii]